jgi:hypothetical protein
VLPIDVGKAQCVRHLSSPPERRLPGAEQNLIDGIADSANTYHNRERSPGNVHLPRKLYIHHLTMKPTFDHVVGLKVVTQILGLQYRPRTAARVSPPLPLLALVQCPC